MRLFAMTNQVSTRKFSLNFISPVFGSPLKALRIGLCVCAAAGVLAGCASTPVQKAKFSPKKYGVKGSPKVVASGPVPKGGGRYMVGKKYKIAGKWYYPKLDPNYEKVGYASWYGPTFHGRKTANGEVFDRNALTAAHTTMPLPSYARVTNLTNGRSMIVRVNDRGPFHGNRVIDLSERVATLLGTKSEGVAKVKVEYVGRARMDGHDESFLMASLTGPGAVQPGATRPGTMLASATPPAGVASQVTPAAFAGTAPMPPSRPYDAAFAVASASPVSGGALVATAFDPALAYEASTQSVQLASNNPFQAVTNVQDPEPKAQAYTASGSGTATQSGVLGTLQIPVPASAQSITAGSAVSSFAASGRISAAYDAVAEMSGTSLSMRELASR